MAKSCAAGPSQSFVAERPGPTSPRLPPECRRRHLRIGCSWSWDVAAEAPIIRRLRMHLKDSCT
jgi:hypothetical protein